MDQAIFSSEGGLMHHSCTFNLGHTLCAKKVSNSKHEAQNLNKYVSKIMLYCYNILTQVNFVYKLMSCRINSDVVQVRRVTVVER